MILTFDIGGSFIKYALFDDNDTIIKEGKNTTPKDSYQALLESIEATFFKFSNIEAIGIACPGTIHHGDQRVYYGGSLQYLHGRNLKKDLELKLKVNVEMENDAKAGALGESRFGSLRNVKEGIYIVLGSGVGCGLVFDGRVRNGSNHSAGEISYMVDGGTFSTENYRNMFGFKGSAVLMVKHIAELKNIEEDGLKVFELINQRDEESYKIFDEYCEIIADKIVNLNYLLDVDVIAIGGGMSQQPIVIETIASKVLHKTPSVFVMKPTIVACHLGAKAKLYGALALTKEKKGSK